MKKRFGGTYGSAIALLPLVKAVRMGGESVIAGIPGGVKEFLAQQALDFEEVKYG